MDRLPETTRWSVRERLALKEPFFRSLITILFPFLPSRPMPRNARSSLHRDVVVVAVPENQSPTQTHLIFRTLFPSSRFAPPRKGPASSRPRQLCHLGDNLEKRCTHQAHRFSKLPLSISLAKAPPSVHAPPSITAVALANRLPLQQKHHRLNHSVQFRIA